MMIYWVILLCSIQLPTKVLNRLWSISKVPAEDGTNCNITYITLHDKWEVQAWKGQTWRVIERLFQALEGAQFTFDKVPRCFFS